jgi:hypothetical protein
MSMPGDAAPSGRKDRGLTAASSSAIAQAIDFPDISHAMPKFIVAVAMNKTTAGAGGTVGTCAVLTPSEALVSNRSTRFCGRKRGSFCRKSRMKPTAPARHVPGQGSGSQHNFLGGNNGQTPDTQIDWWCGSDGRCRFA